MAVCGKPSGSEHTHTHRHTHTHTHTHTLRHIRRTQGWGHTPIYSECERRHCCKRTQGEQRTVPACNDNNMFAKRTHTHTQTHTDTHGPPRFETKGLLSFFLFSAISSLSPTPGGDASTHSQYGTQSLRAI